MDHMAHIGSGSYAVCCLPPKRVRVGGCECVIVIREKEKSHGFSL